MNGQDNDVSDIEAQINIFIITEVKFYWPKNILSVDKF